MKNLVFPVEEYLQRVEKTRKSMQEHGIDVLIVTDPANMNYLTGFDGWSFYVHQGVIVALDLDQPIWFGRGQDGNAARLTTYLDENNIYAYTDDYVNNPLKHPYEYVAVKYAAGGHPTERRLLCAGCTVSSALFRHSSAKLPLYIYYISMVNC